MDVFCNDDIDSNNSRNITWCQYLRLVNWMVFKCVNNDVLCSVCVSEDEFAS